MGKGGNKTAVSRKGQAETKADHGHAPDNGNAEHLEEFTIAWHRTGGRSKSIPQGHQREEGGNKKGQPDEKDGVKSPLMNHAFGHDGAQCDAHQGRDTKVADPFGEPGRGHQVGGHGQTGDNAERQAHAEHQPQYQKQGEGLIDGTINKKVDHAHQHQQQARDHQAGLAANSIHKFGNHGTSTNRRQGHGPHEDADIGLAAPNIQNIQGEQEKYPHAGLQDHTTGQ
ncbi:hypothetical protein DESC_870010 [Desulfosarcina cetonica]|nr:hypothetical protein DESC_870010 [Desulfosarcina cetonica]